jgi:Transglycosylase SLT domain
LPFRLSLLALALGAFLVIPAPPARATTEVPGCAVVIEQAGVWLAREGTSGATPGILAQLRELGPRLIECDDAEEPEWGTGMGDDPERWRGVAAFYFAPEDVDRVICLIGFESGGNPAAVNPTSGAAGLMQVMPFWAARHDYEQDLLFNPAVNLWIASQIRDEQGWGAWTPYQRGECR